MEYICTIALQSRMKNCPSAFHIPHRLVPAEQTGLWLLPVVGMSCPGHCHPLCSDRHISGTYADLYSDFSQSFVVSL